MTSTCLEEIEDVLGCMGEQDLSYGLFLVHQDLGTACELSDVWL